MFVVAPLAWTIAVGEVLILGGGQGGDNGLHGEVQDPMFVVAPLAWTIAVSEVFLVRGGQQGDDGLHSGVQDMCVAPPFFRIIAVGKVLILGGRQGGDDGLHDVVHDLHMWWEGRQTDCNLQQSAVFSSSPWPPSRWSADHAVGSSSILLRSSRHQHLPHHRCGNALCSCYSYRLPFCLNNFHPRPPLPQRMMAGRWSRGRAALRPQR
mmetsp:Transcript_11617/g.25449  ORF Transcript_11617/g.25449 Transcript_11617/m.25449 type:complete len:208 (+) Transcript_11617:834-1457(+)